MWVVRLWADPVGHLSSMTRTVWHPGLGESGATGPEVGAVRALVLKLSHLAGKELGRALCISSLS